MTPPQIPLRRVPVGAWVLLDGKPALVVASFTSHVNLRRGITGIEQRNTNALVTPFASTAPRLLTDADIGAWIWDPEHDHCLDEVMQVKGLSANGDWLTEEGWYLDLDWPVWIVRPAPEAKPALRAVAARQDREKDFLRPERPSAQPAPEAESTDRPAWTSLMLHAGITVSQMAVWLRSLKEHGYADILDAMQEPDRAIEHVRPFAVTHGDLAPSVAQAIADAAMRYGCQAIVTMCDGQRQPCHLGESHGAHHDSGIHRMPPHDYEPAVTAPSLPDGDR